MEEAQNFTKVPNKRCSAMLAPRGRIAVKR